MRTVNSPRISPPGSDYRHAERVLVLPFYNSSRKSFAVKWRRSGGSGGGCCGSTSSRNRKRPNSSAGTGACFSGMSERQHFTRR